ncbi:heavy metal translocating P-type ATPase [Falseniella ignava]|uniref:Heavy metal translocating P-type ATPase n=1 Tax=Falseniella ignava CCUG 37419 TaxID=883112 RepID=K1LSL7_9LACT|nr:heavy metal translocating P-type ATPase [Falseniella ignava]EKB57926.1 heavy metal translocating P-type ATPase [Falseniella ignava CCUG 37419]
MFRYIIKNKEGRFLLIGTVLMIIGFILTGMNSSLSRPVFIVSMFFLGYYAAKNALVETIEQKSPNVDLLMILAAVGAMAIQYESEGAMLLFIFATAEMLEEYAMNKTSSAIEGLMSHVPSVAQKLLDNGEVVEVPTYSLEIGDVVVVSKGDQIPIDGEIDRSAMLNEAALTGESIPIEKEKGDAAFAGTINEGNAFYLKVTTAYDETVFSNIVRMVEEAQGRPSKISSFIDRFESKYVITTLTVVPLFIALLYFWRGYSFQDAFYRGMVLLTVASPCALVASATPATLSAISNGARNGVLFKGGAAMEAFSTMDILYSDKTGTITEGVFKVVEYQLADSILAEVVYMEQQSNHPIAEAIVNSFSDISLSQVNTTQEVEEVAGSGLKKGDILIGKPSSFLNYKDYDHFAEHLESSFTTVFVAKGKQVVGFLTLQDQVREESAEAIRLFTDSGVHVQMVTGDNESVAKEVSQHVAIEHYYANCLPEDKIEFVQRDQQAGHVVGMIGDGINDAPALANADIGIAMGSGSSVAMESSDVVIVQNDLLKLFYSYDLSHRLNRIIRQNIIFAVGVIIALIVLNLIGWLDLPTGVVFHEGSTILVILNGLRILKTKK